MSLWLQSLGYDLYDCGDNLEEKAKCILAYLSMPVPRSWWEHALQIGSIPDSYILILQDLHKELIKTPELPERPELVLLVALGFVDEHIEDQEKIFGTVYSQHSIEEYLSKAKEICARRPELSKLVENVDTKAKNILPKH